MVNTARRSFPRDAKDEATRPRNDLVSRDPEPALGDGERVVVGFRRLRAVHAALNVLVFLVGATRRRRRRAPLLGRGDRGGGVERREKSGSAQVRLAVADERLVRAAADLVRQHDGDAVAEARGLVGGGARRHPCARGYVATR